MTSLFANVAAAQAAFDAAMERLRASFARNGRQLHPLEPVHHPGPFYHGGAPGLVPGEALKPLHDKPQRRGL